MLYPIVTLLMKKRKIRGSVRGTLGVMLAACLCADKAPFLHAYRVLIWGYHLQGIQPHKRGRRKNRLRIKALMNDALSKVVKQKHNWHLLCQNSLDG